MHDRDASIHLGCAGWSLRREQQEDFPPGGSLLERYAGIFSAVEINSSFYRPHRPDTYARWRDSVPEGFRFSVKMPREITHARRLRGCAGLIAAFLDGAGRLEGKLGCLLVQLPPSLRYDAATAGEFFAALRTLADTAIACEPRHPGWFLPEATALLGAYGIARVEADPSPVSVRGVAPESGVAYLRLHGSPVMYRSAYPTDFLDGLAARIRGLRKAGKTVWCVFDNTAEGAAVADALSLRARLREAG